VTATASFHGGLPATRRRGASPTASTR
jgi:hypothetical protein